MSKPIVTNTQSAEIKRRYESGETAPEIATSLGVQPHHVYRTLIVLGVKRRRRGRVTGFKPEGYTEREERNRQIVAWYQTGLSLREIGKQVGLTRQAVQLILKAEGIARRASGRAKKVRT